MDWWLVYRVFFSLCILALLWLIVDAIYNLLSKHKPIKFSDIYDVGKWMPKLILLFLKKDVFYHIVRVVNKNSDKWYLSDGRTISSIKTENGRLLYFNWALSSREILKLWHLSEL